MWKTCHLNMEIHQIIGGLNQTIETLLANDADTLIRGLNERIISGRLASYLQQIFTDYNVDPNTTMILTNRMIERRKILHEKRLSK